MKLQTIIITAMALAMPLLAEETNRVDEAKAEKPEAAERQDQKRDDFSREGGRSSKKRNLKLMERALNEIGVSEEQRQQIMELQFKHMKKMNASWKRMNKARWELSRLQDESASMEVIDVAIKEVSDAQAEQLQILCRNRMEMEKILGKEKNDLLMKKAREFFNTHGRRPVGGMPPRPDVPPLPGNDQARHWTPPPTPPVGGMPCCDNLPPA